MNKKAEGILFLFNRTKIEILLAIYKCGDNTCSCDLVENLKIPKNLISYHIKTLREHGYVEEVRCGKRKRFRVASKKLSKVREVFKVLEVSQGV